MMNNNIDTIFQELYKLATPRTKASLEKVKEACDSQVSRKSTDFSVATIARISEEVGGVKAQAIRNKTGEHFRKLIAVYEATYSLPVPKQVKTDPLSWFNQIENPSIRYQVLDLAAENKRLKNELNLIKSVTTIDVDFRNNTNHEQDPTLLESKLDSNELKALTDFISDTRLSDFGWKRGTNGRLVDGEGRPVTKPSFVDAIEKLATVMEATNG